MCNRARYAGEPETLWGSAAKLFGDRPVDNRFDPKELRPKGRGYVIREQDGKRAWEIIEWDVLGGGASWPMTNVRNLALPQWRRLAEKPETAPAQRPAANGRMNISDLVDGPSFSPTWTNTTFDSTATHDITHMDDHN